MLSLENPVNNETIFCLIIEGFQGRSTETGTRFGFCRFKNHAVTPCESGKYPLSGKFRVDNPGYHAITET